MRRSTATLLLVAGLALCLPATAWTAPDERPPAPDEVRQRAAEILARRGYQTELPEPKPPSTPGWLDRLLRWLATLGLGRLFLAILLAIVVIVGVMLLWQLMVGDADASHPVLSEAASADAGPLLTLADAQRMAAEGAFGDAVHVLLIVALAQLQREQGTPLGPSLTSRELIRSFTLDRSRQTSLEQLVAAVEWSLFGGRSVTRESYERCAQHWAVVVEQRA